MDTEERLMDSALVVGLIATIIFTAWIILHTLSMAIKEIQIKGGGPKDRTTIYEEIYGD